MDTTDLRKELAHWQNCHKQMVERNALLRDRYDLPVDRIVAYRTLLQLQKENELLQQHVPDLIMSGGLIKTLHMPSILRK